jgi:hypothetical protein
MIKQTVVCRLAANCYSGRTFNQKNHWLNLPNQQQQHQHQNRRKNRQRKHKYVKMFIISIFCGFLYYLSLVFSIHNTDVFLWPKDLNGFSRPANTHSEDISFWGLAGDGFFLLLLPSVSSAFSKVQSAVLMGAHVGDILNDMCVLLSKMSLTIYCIREYKEVWSWKAHSQSHITGDYIDNHLNNEHSSSSLSVWTIKKENSFFTVHFPLLLLSY